MCKADVQLFESCGQRAVRRMKKLNFVLTPQLRRKPLLTTLAVAFALHGCGGGGDDGRDTGATNTMPVHCDSFSSPCS